MTTTSEVMGTIHDTLTEFHDQCLRWEQEFDALFNELETLELSPNDSMSTSDNQGASQLHELAEQITVENIELLRRQDKISSDLSGLRKLVEEQGEMFSGLLGAQPRDAENNHVEP